MMAKLETGNIGIGNIRTMATFDKATFGNLSTIRVRFLRNPLVDEAAFL